MEDYSPLVPQLSEEPPSHSLEPSLSHDALEHCENLVSRPPVWDIGLPRTGTTSFCHALKILGYQRVAHNPHFNSLSSLEGASDIGCAVFYKYIDYKHPNSKFVLCLRDLESWLDSIRFIFERYPIPVPQRSSLEQDVAALLCTMLYESTTFDRTKFIDAYHRHHDDVRRYFRNRPEDLLELNIIDGDGWEQLCPFLGLPIPDSPFPQANKRTDFYPDLVSIPGNFRLCF